MSWDHHIAKLKAGETVQFRPRGSSMMPKIKSGQLCTVEPVVDSTPLGVGTVVLCKVKGKLYLHLIKAVQTSFPNPHDGLYQIGNNRGHVNGWINANSIYGRLVRVEP